MSKNPKNLRTSSYWRIISSYLHILWRSGGISIKLSEKMWLMIILKVAKTQGFNISLRNTFLKKPQGAQIEPPIFLRLSYYMLLFENFSKYTNKLFDKSPLWQLLLFSVGEHAKQDNYNYSSVRNNQVFLINGVIKLQLEKSVKRNKQRFWDK